MKTKLWKKKFFFGQNKCIPRKFLPFCLLNTKKKTPTKRLELYVCLHSTTAEAGDGRKAFEPPLHYFWEMKNRHS